MYIGDISAADIVRAQLKDKDFEDLVRRLLETELDLRHAATAEVRGPVPPYHGDGKRDLIVRVADEPRTPRTSFRASLTWDERERQTWYSCKGGSGWKRSFLDELGATGKPGKKRPPAHLLDHLSKGRRFVFVIAEQTLDDDDFLTKAESGLGYWLDHERGGRPGTLRQQLHVIDAHALARFIAVHKPSNLGEPLRRALGIDAPEGFQEWERWTKELGGRELTEFESDPSRDEILTAIADASRPVIRIFGPPGAGKTRVAHEGIRRLGEDVCARVLYCGDPQRGRRLGDWLEGAGRPWVVLDELRTIDVEDIEAKFDALAPDGARLFLIGTSDEGTRAEHGRAFALGELDERAIERLIRHEFGLSGSTPSDEQVAVVCSLSERYPWYAILLARALAREPESFARGVDEATRWSIGARRVLAGPRGDHASPQHWEREAQLRAKCLLVAMMTRDLELPWDEIWERHGEALGMALREPRDWHEVKERALACRHRQILRQSGARAQRRYVSPNNLARIILNHFFGPDGPDLGPTIRRHAPYFRGVLLGIAKAVHATVAIRELARGEWQELARRAGEDGIDAVTEYLSPRRVAYEAALEAPREAAEGIGSALVQLDDRALAAAARARAVLREALAHVVHRAIPSEAFLAAEASLFRLARLDDEPWSNNATGVWKNLFLPSLHQTHQPWELRLVRLDGRLANKDPGIRGLAVEALGLAVGASESALGHGDDDLRDGDWPRPTLDDLAAQKDQLWKRLLDACHDSSEHVADRARRAVTGHFRTGVGRRLHAPELHRLATMVSSWTVEQRRMLIEKFLDLQRYDAARTATLPSETRDALSALEAALAPTNLRERVVVQVGTWTPGPWRIDDDDRPTHERFVDRALARELLESPEDQPWVLRWLLGPEAHRSRSFWRALGFVDQPRVIREQLVDLVEHGASPRALTDYLLGWSDDEGPEAPEAWIEPRIEDARLASAFVELLILLPPSIPRLVRLQDLITRGASADGLWMLAHRGWASTLEVGPMLSLVRSLGTRSDLVSVELALIVELLDREPLAREREELLERLGRALSVSLEQRVVIASQGWYERGVLALAGDGRFGVIVTLLVKMLDVSENQSNLGLAPSLMAALIGKGFGERLWPHVASAMTEKPHSLLGLQLAEENLLAHVPPEHVLAWVGEDQRRANIAAELCNPHEQGLDEVTRQLLIRFGADGAVARTLQARARSTPGVIPGARGDFERQQREHAARWAEDSHPTVRRWAEQLEESLRRSIEDDEARRHIRRKYG